MRVKVFASPRLAVSRTGAVKEGVLNGLGQFPTGACYQFFGEWGELSTSKEACCVFAVRP